MYDMYPWYGTQAQSASPTIPRTPATAAVQIALDRRDNGGDAAAEPAVALALQ